MKEIAKEELKNEMRDLETEVNHLKSNRDKELQQVHARYLAHFAIFCKF